MLYWYKYQIQRALVALGITALAARVTVLEDAPAGGVLQTVGTAVIHFTGNGVTPLTVTIQKVVTGKIVTLMFPVMLFATGDGTAPTCTDIPVELQPDWTIDPDAYGFNFPILIHEGAADKLSVVNWFQDGVNSIFTVTPNSAGNNAIYPFAITYKIA